MIAVKAVHPAPVPPETPFRLNTGRIRDQWHTMTRTGLVPRLAQHLGEPFVEIHPADATRLGLGAASLAELTSPQGRAVLRVMVSDRVAPGHPFAPIHWTSETAPSGRIGALVPAVTDPVSGQPATKSAAVAIRPFAAAWYGYAVTRRDVAPDCAYWAKAPVVGGQQLELAGEAVPEDWAAWADGLFGLGSPSALVADPARGLIRMAFAIEGRLEAALFVGRDPARLSRGHVAALLGMEGHFVLAGHPAADRPDPGPTICACMNVGLNTILRAVAEDGVISVEAIGAAVGAGTNCGSCRPDLATLIARHRHREAAE
jgi:assimilatory nitrate reductase catalytic subunit